MYVCLCSGITDQQIRDAIQAGDSDLKTLRKKLGLANSCGMCVSDAREILTAESDRLAEQAMMVEIVDAGQKAA
ncbi:MAG: (2Fe-2S)-binding protein [Oceanospirillum sp.]|nr:(2Fe-2S)-binding protein [Oceanospirillum sp.]